MLFHENCLAKKVDIQHLRQSALGFKMKRPTNTERLVSVFETHKNHINYNYNDIDIQEYVYVIKVAIPN